MLFSAKKRKLIAACLLVVFVTGGILAAKPEIRIAKAQEGYTQEQVGEPLTTEETAKAIAKGMPETSFWEMRIPVIGHIIGAVLFIIQWLLSKILYIGASLADAVLSFNSFTKNPIVQFGWKITRDLANMFFALILLLMAFATILRLERFGMKQILWRLILAALLINFSLVFAGVLIDFAQVFTDYFINAARGDSLLSDQITAGLGIQKLYQAKDQNWIDKIWDYVFGPSFGMMVEMFLGIIVLLVANFAFFALAFFLLVRIVALWLLLIFAPLAWTAMIVPGGQAGGIWGQWWRAFFKWTFFAPIYAFFLYLALMIPKLNAVSLETANILSSGLKNEFPVGTDASTGTISAFTSSPLVILQFIVIIIILLGGLQVAQKFGIYGAGAVMKLGSAMKGAAWRGSQRWMAQGGKIPGMEKAGKWIDKKLGEKEWYKGLKGKYGPAAQKALALKQRVISTMTPEVWKRAWALKRAKADNRAFSEATGDLRDLLSRGGIKKAIRGEKGVYGQLEREKVLAAEAGELTRAIPDEPRRAAAMIEAIEKNNEWDKEVIMRSLAMTNSYNTLRAEQFKKQARKEELMETAQRLAAEIGTKLEGVLRRQKTLEKEKGEGRVTDSEYQTRKTNLEKDEENIRQELQTKKEAAKGSATGISLADLEKKYALNPENFQNFMLETFGKIKGARIGNDVQNAQLAIGNLSNYGAFAWDEELGKFREALAEERQAVAAAKFNEREPQEFWRLTHPDSFFETTFEVTADGKTNWRTSDITDTGKLYFENMTGLHLGQMHRAQPRTLKKILDNSKLILKKVTPTQQAEKITNRAKEVKQGATRGEGGD